MMKYLLWLLLPITLAACTSQELYDQTQRQVKLNCNQKVGVEKEQCLKKLNEKSYEEYEKERKEVINN